MRLLITNIHTLVQCEETPRSIVRGADMRTLPCLNDAWLLIDNELIADFGPMSELEQKGHLSADQIIDASGKMVFPSWCDSHTHIVYAGSRETEFVDRIHGLSYEEIAERGGGILNSAQRLQACPEEELLEQAWNRLQEIKGFGTGAVEIKSGYGLSLDSELKMLRVIRRLKDMSQLRIKASFLGAHAVPQVYKNNRNEYIDLIINKMLPQVAEEGLADYCDVFCDRGFYTVEETDRILQAAAKFGLKPKIHANELDYSGGVQVGVKNAAISVDHLECVGDAEIESLLNSDTMPTILPSTAFFLNLEYAPVRKMMEAGLPLALASDYNPGSTPSGRMSFVLSLACIKMRMTPEEAINAVTINGARAMELEKDYGSIARGKVANLFITKPIPSIAFIPYSFGSDLIDEVILRGKRNAC